MSGEKAIREYLQYLSDPASLRDEAEVTRLNAAATAANDPIERLKLLSAAQRAHDVDGSRFEQAFVANAAAWAAAERVTPEAFRALGVPAEVLAAAGLLRGRPTPTRRRRATVVTAETVMAAVPDGPFSVRDLMESSGASLQTVRKAVRTMLGAGDLIDLGLDPDWNGRGRTPTLYRRS